jgi:hypothetical protein
MFDSLKIHIALANMRELIISPRFSVHSHLKE